jgi:polysaccharide biosynthesis/export protein
VRFPVRVLDNGMGDLPIIGQVPLHGLEMEAAEAAIASACVQQGLYRSPYVTVTMKKQRVNRVTVVGAVKNPGVYAIPRGRSDLLAALVSAGGLAEDAGTQVEIRNPTLTPGQNPGAMPAPIADAESGDVNSVAHSWTTPAVSAAYSSMKIDLVSATKSNTGGYSVQDGGVIYVEKRDPEPVHVIGLVVKPNRYEMPVGQDLRLTDVIALSGGISNPVADKVFVIRKKPDASGTVIVNVSLADAKRDERINLRLSPGDVVSVEQTPATVVIEALRFMNLGIGASLPLTAL